MNRDDVSFGTEIEGSVGDGGGGESDFAELVFGQLLEFAAGLDDVDFAILAGEIDAAFGGDGGGGEAGRAGAEALLVLLLAGEGVVDLKDAGVRDAVNEAFVGDGRGEVGSVAFLAPGLGAVGAEGEEGAGFAVGLGDVNEPVGHEGDGNGDVAAGGDAPLFLAGETVIGGEEGVTVADDEIAEDAGGAPTGGGGGVTVGAPELLAVG